MPDKVKVKVVGDCRVAGVDPGGRVELDPETVNIPALVEGGHVELVAEAAPTKGSKAGAQ